MVPDSSKEESTVCSETAPISHESVISLGLWRTNPADAGAKASPFVNLYAYLTVDYRKHERHLKSGTALERIQDYTREVIEAKKTAGTAEIVGAILTSPIRSFRHASLRHGKYVGSYTFHLLAPTGGIALLAPHALVLAFPTYVQNILASKPEPLTVISVPGGPEATESEIDCARAGVAGMAITSRARMTASARVRKSLLFFISHLN